MEARVVDFDFVVVLLDVVVVVVVETKASQPPPPPPPPPPPHTRAVTAKGWNFMIGRSDDEEEAVCTVCLFLCLFTFQEQRTTPPTPLEPTNHTHRHQRKDLIRLLDGGGINSERTRQSSLGRMYDSVDVLGWTNQKPGASGFPPK